MQLLTRGDATTNNYKPSHTYNPSFIPNVLPPHPKEKVKRDGILQLIHSNEIVERELHLNSK